MTIVVAATGSSFIVLIREFLSHVLELCQEKFDRFFHDKLDTLEIRLIKQMAIHTPWIECHADVQTLGLKKSGP